MKGRYSDESIYRGIKEGNPAITGYIYEMYWVDVQNIIVAKGGTKAEAGDAFQNVMLNLFIKIREGEIKINDFRGYFIKSCVNEYFLGKRGAVINRGLNEEELELTDEEYDEEEKLKRTRLALRSFRILKEDCKKIIRLRSQDLSYSKISKLLNLKGETSAKKRRERCLKYFYGIYFKLLRDEEE